MTGTFIGTTGYGVLSDWIDTSEAERAVSLIMSQGRISSGTTPSSEGGG